MDLSKFIRSLTILVPTGSILFLSGMPSDKELQAFLASNSVALLQRKWLLPSGYHIFSNENVLKNIADMIQGLDAAPTELDVYYQKTFLIRWFDVITTNVPIYVNKSISESKIADFCKEIGCNYTPRPLQNTFERGG